MTSTPTPKVRLTISVTPEVHAVFQRLAKGTSTSIGRAMGDWLGDTVEAAEFMASKVEQARSAPGMVIRELQAYTLGLTDEANSLMEQFREKGRVQRGASAAGGALRSGVAPAAVASPPSSNTGGKGRTTNRAKGGKVV